MHSDKDMDKIIVVTTSAEIQQHRVLARDDMNEEKLTFILSKQMPDVEKRQKADYIVDTSDSLEAAQLQVNAIVDIINGLADEL